MPSEPVQLPCALAGEVGHGTEIRRRLDEALARAGALGPERLAGLFAETPGTVQDVLGLATRRDRPGITSIVTCPDAPFALGRGVVTDLLVGFGGGSAEDEEGDDLRNVVLRGTYADWSDGWTIHVTPPRDLFAGMAVQGVSAELWLSIARRWATVDVTLTVVSDSGRLVLLAPPIEAPVVDPDAPIHSGFRLVAASLDERPADLVLGAGGYLVIGGVGTEPVSLRLRYEGPLPLVGENQAEARVLGLHRWMPTVPYGPPVPVQLVVHHPAEEHLVASLPAQGATGVDEAGWRVTRLSGETDRDPSLALLDRAPAAQVWEDRAGNRVEIIAAALPPANRCAAALERIAAALAPVGRFGQVRIVAVPAIHGRHGRRAGDTIVLFEEKLADLCLPLDFPVAELARRQVEAAALVAHELAHGWFGVAVRGADDEAGAWFEAAAEYVSLWPVDEVAAVATRRRWSEDYADQTHRDMFGVAQRVPTSGRLRDALSYGKGALILTALEQRIGRDRVAAMLRHLVATRAGEVGSWLDLVAATHVVAGSRDADWLQRWVLAIGAPELRVVDVRSADGKVELVIAQDAEVPFDATVDVAIYAGDQLLVLGGVALSGQRTAATLPAPPGADRIVVDPWFRLPRFGVAEATIR
jgi:hypothetical protein